jgi:hypothetical protein
LAWYDWEAGPANFLNCVVTLSPSENLPPLENDPNSPDSDTPTLNVVLWPLVSFAVADIPECRSYVWSTIPYALW